MRRVIQASYIPSQRTLRLREGGANLPSHSITGSQDPKGPPFQQGFLSILSASGQPGVPLASSPQQGEGLGGAVTAERVRTQFVGLMGETPPSARLLWGLGGSLVDGVHPSWG